MTRLTTSLPSSRRRRAATVGPRPRVEFSDAAAVRERVESSAAELRLRGARRHALTAVLKLLCGYSRLTDDRIGLSQIVDLIAAAGRRRYDVKTVGRALASLAADELILYRPHKAAGSTPWSPSIPGSPKASRSFNGTALARNRRLHRPFQDRFRHLFRAASLYRPKELPPYPPERQAARDFSTDWGEGSPRRTQDRHGRTA